MKKILVIVDGQYDFTSGVLGNADCEEAVPEIVNVIETGDYDEIIQTRDTHYEDTYADTQEGRNLSVLHTVYGSRGWQIRDEITTAVSKKSCSVKIFNKSQFGCPELWFYLKDEYGDEAEVQIDFVGFITGICVISNVLPTKAVLPEAIVRVIAKACACATPESHETALNAMELCQVVIVR